MADPSPSRWNPGNWPMALMILFAFFLLVAISFGAKSLSYFADTSYARGVITFVISLSTIAVAFVLVYQAFFATEPQDDRFRRGREVFTGLMGVLGTIVGFYFGAADGTGARLSLAALRLTGREVASFVSGGLPPYRYTTASGDRKGEQKISANGWIVDTLGEAPTPTTTITIDVLDSKNQGVSQSLTIPKAADSGTTASDTTKRQ